MQPQDANLRWVLYPLAAAGFLLFFAAARDKHKLLWGLFLLSLQADLKLRFFFGHAGSEGLAFPLAVVAGFAVLGHGIVSGRFGSHSRFVWAGRLRPALIAFFATSVFSLLGTSERFVGLTQLLFEIELFLMYWLALNLVRSEADIKSTLSILYIALGIQSIIYFMQSALGVTFTMAGEVFALGELPRPGGTVGKNPAMFASFILPILLIVIAQFLTVESPRERRRMGVLSLAGVAALILTFTRAAWVAFAVGTMSLIIFGYRRRALRLSRFAPVGAAIVGVVLVFSPMIVNRLSTSPVSADYEERLRLMRIALRVVAAHPIAGVGIGAYNSIYKSFLNADEQGQWVFAVHNAYLLRAAETGVPGACAFVMLLVLGLLQAVRLARARSRFIRTVALGAGAGFLALSCEMYWDTWWAGFTYNALLWFLLGLMEAAERLEKRKARRPVEALAAVA
jgi:O-antigen ligase